MAAKLLATSFGERIATRSTARFYAWIIAGLLVLYIVTFPLLGSPILISIPVVIAGWFYHRRGGLVASILAIVLNLFLVTRFIGPLSWNALYDLRNGFLIGHLFVILISLLVGYLREVFENIFQLNQRLRSQERFLAL